MSAHDDLVASLVGAWPDPVPMPVAIRPGDDVFGAVACSFDLAPTDSGPLDGVSLAVKDNIAVAGVPTAVGTGSPGFVSHEDATIVARARAAGARVIAKAQCEYLLLGANSFTSRPSPVRNPRAPTRSAGGSSSGSAAMVAAGLADMAIGTDSGGSIRIPAAYCGLVGFKPTRGRVPYTGIAPLEPFLEHAGPITRSVVEAARLFRVLDGPDHRDCRTAWRMDLATAGPATDKPVRLGVLRSAFDAVEAHVGVALSEALERMAAAGAELRDAAWPDFGEAGALDLALYGTGQALVARNLCGCPGLIPSLPSGWAEWRKGLGDMPSALAQALEAGGALVDADPGLYGRGVRRALKMAEQLDALLGDVDALVLPTTRDVPACIPAGEPDDEAIYGDTSFTAPFNVTGAPALSLPVSEALSLPVGMQLVSRRGADEALLATAAWVEAALSHDHQEKHP